MKKQTHKKPIALFILVILISISCIPMIGSGQQERNSELEIIIENSDIDTIKISAQIPEFTFSTTEHDDEKYAIINLADEGFSIIDGQAKLPKIRRMVEIPQDATPNIIINDITWEETSLNNLHMPNRILPRQPSVHKTGEIPTFEIDEDWYNTNQYYPEEAAIVFEINQIRGTRFALIEIAPVQYNPFSGDLRLLISCDITMDLQGSDIEKTISNIERYATPVFDDMLSSLFPNYGYYEAFAQPNRDQEGFLIIVYDDFEDEINPLASWKTTMGYDTTVTLTSEIPGGVTTNTIKAYIQEAYDTWTNPPAYILLVGDTPQIPAFTGPHSGGETDTYFVTMDGEDDLFADIHVGRFPAENEEQVTIMTDKTIYYEQGVFPDIEWIKKAAFIASSDHDQLAEETHNYCIDTWLDPNGYACDKIYEASGGNTQDIYDSLNDGRSICIYSGHGGSTGWGCVPFSNSDVYLLENEGMYPFVCSHACSTSTYEGTSETFSEAWVRAENKGGIAMWGSSVSTYWDEDDAIQRRVFDAWWNDSMVRIGQMTDKGMYDAYQQNPGLEIDKFIESYNIMGDASVKIWTDDPFIPDHDITVTDIVVPEVVAHGETQTVSAFVKNSGNNTETNIVVDFKVDDFVVDTTIIPSLDKMESTIVNFLWDPAIGTYLVAVESQPIPDEYDLLNNHVDTTVDVIAAPAIEVTPMTLNYMVPTNAVDTDSITIFNLVSAEAPLDYAISYAGDLGGSWLSALPASGSVAVDDADVVIITVDTTGLSEGDYNGEVIIASNDLDDPEVIVTVSLTVVFGNDMAVLSINNPVGVIPAGAYTVNATVQNKGFYPQTDVLVNCSIFEGGIGGVIIDEDFASDPTDWTITNVEGTAWTWDSSEERMEHSYSGSPSGYLDSPVLDCSGKLGVNLSFWHYWKADYSSGNQDGYVRGSIDGGLSFPFLIDEFHHNDPADETAVKYYDISSWANNQPQVMIRFDITNDNDWYWYVDDFNVSADITGSLAYTSENLVSLPAYESSYVEFTPEWNANLGVYTIQITTLLAGDENSGNDIILDVVSVEGPSLCFDPLDYNIGTILVNTTDSTSFEIWNCRVGVLSYSLSETCDWLTVAPLSGDSTGEHDMITVDIDTTDLPEGPYHCDISISSNAGAGVFTVDMNVISDTTPLEDVNQSMFDRGFPIRHTWDGDWGAAQNFTPSMSVIPQVDIYLRKFGTPEFDLTVELRENGPEGLLIDSLVFPAAEVPSSWTWLIVDFSDTVVNSGTDYFIVLPPAPSGVSTSFGYEWGYAFGDHYQPGSFWFTRDGGGLWRDLPTMYEFTFITYGLG